MHFKSREEEEEEEVGVEGAVERGEERRHGAGLLTRPHGQLSVMTA